MVRTVIATAFLLVATHTATPQADKVLIQKSPRQLTLLETANRFAPITSASDRLRKARRSEGDERTLEGLYTIDSRNAYSKYHLALHVSYPNAADRARARRLHVRPGGEIMIHGTPNRWRGLRVVFAHTDWTKGCIAVSDSDIEEIWRLVPNGTVVEIRP
jgi:murein L,D-transpeptidase YafK